MCTVGPTAVSEVGHSGCHGVQEQRTWPHLANPCGPTDHGPSYDATCQLRSKVWGEGEAVIHIIAIKGPPRNDE